MIVKSPLKKNDIRPNLRKVEKPNGKRSGPGKKAPGKKISLPKLKPWKVILGSIIIAALGVLYLTHVFATQQLLNEVKQMEARFNKSRTTYDELKLQYDRMVGPSEIYRKAESQGFVNGGPAEKIIIIKE